jgi:glucose/arabinose dehydrogenase
MRWAGAVLTVIAILAVFAGVYMEYEGYFAGVAPTEPPASLNISLPEGFSIHVYADVPGARSMSAIGNTVFVGTRGDAVYAVVDRDWDFSGDDVITLDDGLNTPNGVAYRNGSLFVAEIDRILRYEDVITQLNRPPEPQVVFDEYPSETHHGWKYISFGPDGRLYVPVGAPCNICDPEEPFATITRLTKDFSSYEVVARGVRNSVGFDWHPETGTLWFTDNGRDWLGDDRPPDEFNQLSAIGEHFGYPHCHGSIEDPAFGQDCSQFTAPEVELGPHVAALGVEFYNHTVFPDAYHGAFIAEHGSWNRKVPIGYRVMFVPFNGSVPGEAEVFAQGWLGDDGDAWGRPVDVEVLRDGSLLVSDDKAGKIYRITWSGRE